MAEKPYLAMSMYLDVKDKPQPHGRWMYSVNYDGSKGRIMIGDNDEHITILRNTEGFHHTYPGAEDDRDKCPQRTNLKTIDEIITHIESNTRDDKRSPYQNPKILIALKYMANDPVYKNIETSGF
ncbi:MAG: hypothetical protein HKO79_02650 [Desulfobacterales bacterium]|nr:hypothetical protein [Desulfobacterales bacterium]